jgi:hypothetical protein
VDEITKRGERGQGPPGMAEFRVAGVPGKGDAGSGGGIRLPPSMKGKENL